MQQRTLAQNQAWIQQDWRNGIHFAVDNNPRAAYNWIKGNIKDSDFPNWANGFEMADASRLRMRSAIEKAAINSGNASGYTQMFMRAVPYNANTINWTKIIN